MKQVDFTGSVISGTMRPQDVLPAIMDVLWKHHAGAYMEIAVSIRELGASYNDLCANDQHPLWTKGSMAEIIEEDAWNAVNEIAPPGYHFGSHPGDGCDYGFWEVE